MEVRWIRTLAVGAALVLGSASALAQYPERPIRLIIPFTPGGGTDIVARLVGGKVSEKFGQQLLADNRPGASGVIGSDLTAKAPADGYTLLMTTSSQTSNPALIKELPYDSEKDFTPVSLVADLPSLLLVHPSVKADTLTEFIAYAKKNANLNYGTTGVGGFSHLGMEMLISRAGLKMTHVPYKGNSQVMVDLLAGTVQVHMGIYVTADKHVKAGKLKLLAVTSATRMELLPDVPTVAESGFPDFETAFWMGIVGPKQMPEAIRARLESAFIEAVKSEDISKRLINDGMRALGGTGAELAALIKRELPQWQKVVKDANITLN
jgi:tripartite-type tricarboxylate transporter receptor subunit TctC